jgi:hypothetical protein
MFMKLVYKNKIRYKRRDIEIKKKLKYKEYILKIAKNVLRNSKRVDRISGIDIEIEKRVVKGIRKYFGRSGALFGIKKIYRRTNSGYLIMIKSGLNSFSKYVLNLIKLLFSKKVVVIKKNLISIVINNFNTKYKNSISAIIIKINYLIRFNR